MPILPVRWPAQGRNDAEAFSAQPPLTTRDELNVCDLDSTTGRMRGATRSGLSKYVSTQVAAAPIKRGLAVAYDGAKFTYQSETSGTVEVSWSVVLPSKTDCLAVAADKWGNCYATDGLTGIVKYNPDGRLVWRIDLPVDRTLVVRALFVDDIGNVYAATSDTGYVDVVGSIYTSTALTLSAFTQGQGDVTGSRIWKYRQLWDPEQTKDEFDKVITKHTELAWANAIAPGAFVEQMVVRGGVLYTAQNRPHDWHAEVVAYANIDTKSPEELLRVEVPFPVNGIAVKSGSIFTVHESFANRGLTPSAPNATAHAIDWTPKNLTDWKTRIWAWYDASKITSLDTNSGSAELKDNDQVLIWRDQTENGRDLYCPLSNWTEGNFTDIIPPRYRKQSGIGGKPALVFDGFTGSGESLINPARVNGLRSYSNAGASALDKKQQRTMLPGYSGCKFAVFLVIKPSKTTTITRMPVFDQHNTSDGNWEVMLEANAVQSAVDSDAMSTSEGKLLIRERAAGGANGEDGLSTTGTGANEFPYHGTYDAVPSGFSVSPGVAIVSWVNTAGGANTSLYRVNGNALDKYTSKAWTTAGPEYTSIGYRHAFASSGADHWFAGEIAEILVLDFYDDATNDVLSAPPYPGSAFSISNSYSELEKIEGYLAHKYGMAHVLPNHEYVAPAGSIADSATVGVGPAKWPHSYPLVASTATVNPIAADAPKGGPPRATGLDTQSSKFTDLNHTGEILAKWDSAKGDIRWVLKSSSTIGGIGYGVVATADGNVFTFGAKASGNNIISRLTIDAGESPTTTDAYSYAAGGAGWDYKYFRAQVTKHNFLVAPYYEIGSTNHTIQFNNVGTSGTVVALPIFVDVTVGAQIQEAHAVAFDPRIPEFPETDTAGNINLAWTGVTIADQPRPEFVYVGTRLAAAGQATLHKLRLVDKTPTTAAERRFVYAAVANGDIKTFTSSAVATPTGGSGSFDTASQWIDAVSAFGKGWFTDGRTDKKLDPKTATVSNWTSKSSGKGPTGRLLAFWNGRIVRSRDPNNPTLWHMSAYGNPEDWDFVEKISGGVVTQAVSGGEPGFSPCPDIVNMLAPWRNDALVFGCDHSFWVMTGDPRYGGTFQNLNVPVGSGFGHCWAMDDEGALYVFKNTGGVLRFFAGGFQSITDRSIERQMESIAFGTNHIQLVWDDREKSLHVFQEPFASGGTALTHWRWEKRTGAWWTNQYPTTMQPASALVIDGDAAGDRVMLLLGQDGYVRQWSQTAADDDGTAIKSRVTIELEPPDERFMWRWSGLSMEFATSLHAPHVQFLSSDQAEVLEDPEGDHPMQPGANDTLFHPIKGRKCHVRVYSDRRWAFERGQINAYRAGRVRQRAW